MMLFKGKRWFARRSIRDGLSQVSHLLDRQNQGTHHTTLLLCRCNERQWYNDNTPHVDQSNIIHYHLL
jgi:hypothetical protein